MCEGGGCRRRGGRGRGGRRSGRTSEGRGTCQVQVQPLVLKAAEAGLAPAARSCYSAVGGGLARWRGRDHGRSDQEWHRAAAARGFCFWLSLKAKKDSPSAEACVEFGRLVFVNTAVGSAGRCFKLLRNCCFCHSVSVQARAAGAFIGLLTVNLMSNPAAIESSSR